MEECRGARLMSEFPVEGKFMWIGQIRRSSRSSGNSIEEGVGRYGYQENIQFCRQVGGSLFETLDRIIVDFDEGLISFEQL